MHIGLFHSNIRNPSKKKNISADVLHILSLLIALISLNLINKIKTKYSSMIGKNDYVV